MEMLLGQRLSQAPGSADPDAILNAEQALPPSLPRTEPWPQIQKDPYPPPPK